MLYVKGVSKLYGRREVLKKVTFEVNPNQTIILTGHNGSGKSTLLKILTGITLPSKGEVIWGSEPINQQIGYAADRFPKLRLTAAEYLFSMGRIQKIPEPQLYAAIDSLLAQFSLTTAKHQRIEHYSKGMLQKINLIQALLGNPSLLLLDEPLSGLDPSSQHEFIMYLRWLKDKGIAMVIASHEHELITAIADRIISIEDGGAVEVPVRYETQDEIKMTILFEAKQEDWKKRLHGYHLLNQLEHQVKIQIAAVHINLMLRQLIACDCQILEVRREEDHHVYSTPTLFDT